MYKKDFLDGGVWHMAHGHGRRTAVLPKAPLLSDDVSPSFLEATKHVTQGGKRAHAPNLLMILTRDCWSYLWMRKDQAGYMLVYALLFLIMLVAARACMLIIYHKWHLPATVYRDTLAPLLSGVGITGATISPLIFLGLCMHTLLPVGTLLTLFPFFAWRTQSSALRLQDDLLMNGLALFFLILALWTLSSLGIRWMRAISGATTITGKEEESSPRYTWRFFFHKSTGKLFLYTLAVYGALGVPAFTMHTLLKHFPAKIGWHALGAAYYFFLAIIIARLSLVAPLVAHAVCSPFQRSWQLTKGYAVPLVAGHLLFVLPIFLLALYGIGNVFADLLTSDLHPGDETFVWNIALKSTLSYVLLLMLPTFFNTFSWGVLAQKEATLLHPKHVLKGT